MQNTPGGVWERAEQETRHEAGVMLWRDLRPGKRSVQFKLLGHEHAGTNLYILHSIQHQDLDGRPPTYLLNQINLGEILVNITSS